MEYATPECRESCGKVKGDNIESNDRYAALLYGVQTDHFLLRNTTALYLVMSISEPNMYCSTVWWNSYCTSYTEYCRIG